MRGGLQIVLLDICIPIISDIVSLSFGCLSFDPLLNLAFGEAPGTTDFESRDLFCRRQAVNRAFGDLQILGDILEREDVTDGSTLLHVVTG